MPTTPLYDAATCILAMHFVPDDGSKLALLQSIAQRLKSSTVFILVDVFSEKGTREFERMTSIGKCILGRNGYTAAKKAGVARNNYQRYLSNSRAESIGIITANWLCKCYEILSRTLGWQLDSN